MKTYFIIKKTVKTNKHELLETSQAKNERIARKDAVSKYLGKLDMTQEQLIVVGTDGFNKYYKDLV